MDPEPPVRGLVEAIVCREEYHNTRARMLDLDGIRDLMDSFHELGIYFSERGWEDMGGDAMVDGDDYVSSEEDREDE